MITILELGVGSEIGDGTENSLNQLHTASLKRDRNRSWTLYKGRTWPNRVPNSHSEMNLRHYRLVTGKVTEGSSKYQMLQEEPG